jgi:hypothetical protein
VGETLAAEPLRSEGSLVGGKIATARAAG